MTTPVPAEQRERAVQEYLDGASAAAVGRWHGVSHLSVLNWVRAAGYEVRKHGPQPVVIPDLDVSRRGVWVRRRGILVFREAASS